MSLWAAAAVVATTLLAVLPWRWVPPPTTAFIATARRASEGGVRYRWVDRDEIAPALARCVIASEDQKFLDHFGFDFASIWDAAREHTGVRRGASTISQQVAKNLYLWPGRSYLRKGLEAYLTLWIEVLWPKERILEVYLNIAEFGPGVFGAEAASREFFQRPASALSEREAALMAAVLPNPKQLSLANPSPYVRERADEIRRSVRVMRPGGMRVH